MFCFLCFHVDLVGLFLSVFGVVRGPIRFVVLLCGFMLFFSLAFGGTGFRGIVFSLFGKGNWFSILFEGIVF